MPKQTVTPQTAQASTFFTSVPVPGETADSPDTLIDIPSRVSRALGLYAISGTALSSVYKIMASANSRCAGVNSIGGRLWSRNWADAWPRWFWPVCLGFAFHPADLNPSSRFAFDNYGAAPWDSGLGNAIANVRNAAGYTDLSILGFGSLTSTSTGPGGGIALDGSGAAFTQMTRSMENAALPSGMSIFESDGLYGDRNPISGDSLFVKTAEAEMTIVYIKGPGFGTWRWEHVTGSAASDSGTTTPGDPSDSSVESEGTVHMTHTVTASDNYSSRTFTFDVGNVAFADVSVGDAVMVTEVTTNFFRGFGIIEAKTSNSFTVAIDFEDAPQTGDTLHFGPVSLAKETYTMPTTSSEYRGARVTNLTGVNLILGFGAIRNDGTAGVAFGVHGWSGNGYEKHLETWPRNTWYGELCELLGIDLAALHQAGQSSDTEDQLAFAAFIKKASPLTEILHLADPPHTPSGSTEGDYHEALMAQRVHPAVSCLESQFTGTHFAAWLMGHKDNEAHPNMIGHVESIYPMLNAMANLSENTGAIGDVIEREATLLFDMAIKSGSNSGTNYSGDATIEISHATAGPDTSRAILRFNKPTLLRSGAHIDSAILTLNFSAGAGATDADIVIAAIIGNSALDENVTWDEIDGTTAWTIAGGNIKTDPDGTHTGHAPEAAVEYAYDIRHVVESALTLNPNSETIDILIKLDNESENESVTLNAYADDETTPDDQAPTLTIAFVNTTTTPTVDASNIGGVSAGTRGLVPVRPSRRVPRPPPYKVI